jgi:hypothetical protein
MFANGSLYRLDVGSRGRLKTMAGQQDKDAQDSSGYLRGREIVVLHVWKSENRYQETLTR